VIGGTAVALMVRRSRAASAGQEALGVGSAIETGIGIGPDLVVPTQARDQD